MSGDVSKEGADQFWVSASQMAGVTTVVVQGELDLQTAPLVRAKVNEALAQDGTLVIDLTHLTFMDSSGLGILAVAYRQSLGEGRTFQVRNPTPPVRKTLEIAGLDFLIEDAPA